MKKLLLAVLLLFSISGYAQNIDSTKKSPKRNHFAIGYIMNRYQDDFGLGFHIVSPHFAGGASAIKASYNYQWLSYTNTKGENDWISYKSIRIGAIGTGALIEEQIRLYGEGGVCITLANKSMAANTDAKVGGYGIFGFEFLFDKRGTGSYFIELGGIGTGVKADKLPGKPMYSNGFMISTGFRFYL